MKCLSSLTSKRSSKCRLRKIPDKLRASVSGHFRKLTSEPFHPVFNASTADPLPQCPPMPLWTLSIRSLACRQASRYRLGRPWISARWQSPQHRIANYSTALEQNRRDDWLTPQLALAVDHADDINQFESAVSLGEDYENAAWPSVAEVASSPIGTQTRHWRRLSPSQRRWKALREKTHGWKRHPLRQKTLLRGGNMTWAAARGARYRQRRPPARRSRVWNSANPYTLARKFTSHKKPEANSLIWTWWQRSYANIARFYADRNRREGDTPRVPRLRPRAFEWAEAVLDKLDSGQAVITAEDMHSVSVNRWRYCWEQVALWFLTYEPARMIQFLLATNADETLETYVFEDSLLHLARVFKHTNDTARMEQLTDAFCTMVEERPDRKLAFINEFIKLLMDQCSDEQTRRLFDIVNTYNVKLHPYTWLHFTTYFANKNHFETALDCLLIAHKTGAYIDGSAFRSNCTTILRRSSEQPDGLRVCLRAVSTLVDIGVKFNLPICNVIMLNAVEAGDLKTAFSVYHSLMERGLKPDEATFLVLLKGCRMNLDDSQLLDEIIRDAIGNINVRQNEKVATEILYCLALHHSKHRPATALNTIAEAYAQLFDLAPLRKLELPISPSLQIRPPNEHPMPPTRHATTFMINATIHHYLTTASPPTSNTKHLLALYTRWRTHVENASGDPHLASLASTDHLANTFLSAFTRHQKTLLFAARVVRDMQRPLPPTAAPGITQTKPTVQTWSIFLLGFTRHKQMALAEQVLAYMRKQGVEPNRVTWNSLTAGYAGVQDLEGTVEALRRAEREGWVWDAWTGRGLRFLRGREGLRRGSGGEGLDFSGELKEGLQKRLGEVGSGEVVEGFGDSAGEIAELGVDDGGAYRPF